MLKSVFVTSYVDQEETLKSLLKESRERADFFLMIALAAFITTAGLLLDSVVVIIGGMLVAPILFPFLGLSMGIVTSSRLAISRSLKTALRAVGLTFLVSTATAFLLSAESSLNLVSANQPSLIFFLVSLVAGLAVSFSWVRQELSATLPGVAVAVAVLPPLCAVGIGLVMFDGSIMAGSLTLFLINLLGIVLGAMFIFSLFGFSNLQKEEEDRIKEEKVVAQVQKEAIKTAIKEDQVEEETISGGN